MESRIGRHYEPLSDELNPYQQPSTFIDPLTKRYSLKTKILNLTPAEYDSMQAFIIIL